MLSAAPPNNPPVEELSAAIRSEKSPSPTFLFIRLSVLIFITEGIAFALLQVLRPEHVWEDTVIHAFLTTVLFLPILFLFSLRPLLFQIERRQHTEQALQRSQQELEVRVRERTAELLSANQALEQEVAERLRIEARLEQTNRELLALSQAERDQRLLAEGLFKATEALNSSLDLEEVLDRILEQTRRVIPFSAAVVMLIEEQRLRLARYHGIGEIPFTQEATATGQAFDAHPLFAAVCADRRVVTIPQISASPDYPIIPGFEWIQSLMAVPLIRGTEVVGIIALFSDREGIFTQEMAALLEAFAAHAVLAIKNARLYKETLGAHERMQALSHRLVEIQETERRNVARELHDEASQALTALMVGLKLLERSANQPEAVLSGIAGLKHTLESVMEELHRLAIDLRPASLDHLGLIPALNQFADSASQKYGIPVQFEAVGISQRLNPSLETALYRISQEALTNSVRHAQATQVDILLEQRDEQLVLIIEDDGVGFDPAAGLSSGRSGMFGMRERAEMVGGVLKVESTAGVGTTILVEVPFGNSHLAG